jgi:hypothetical protein
VEKRKARGISDMESDMESEKENKAELFYSFFSPVGYRGRGENSGSEDRDSRVLPHGPIGELAPGLWHVTGTLPTPFLVPREMIVYRLPGGGLLIHSPIALSESAMTELESFGPSEIAIVPNRIHRLDIALYKKRYPRLSVICPATARPYVEEVVAVDGIAEDVLPPLGITCHEPAGIRPQELVYELSLPTGKALVFTDILFNLNAAYLRENLKAGEFLLQWLGASAIGSSGFFGITGLGRKFFMTDRDAYRRWLEALAESIPDLRVISVAHGSPIVRDCNARLREAAARLA